MHTDYGSYSIINPDRESKLQYKCMIIIVIFMAVLIMISKLLQNIISLYNKCMFSVHNKYIII